MTNITQLPTVSSSCITMIKIIKLATFGCLSIRLPLVHALVSTHSAIPSWIGCCRWGNRAEKNLPISFRSSSSSCIVRPYFSLASILAEEIEFETIFDDIDDANDFTGDSDEVSEFYRRDLDDDPNAPIPDRAGLSKLLSQRFEKRKACEYDKVREIDILLKRRHGVRAYDNPCVWTRQAKPPASYLRRKARRKANEMVSRFGPTGHPYTQVGKGIDPISCPLTITEIHSLLSRRHQLQLESRYEEADAMRFELMINGVTINEFSRQWRADGVHTFETNCEVLMNKSNGHQIYKEDALSRDNEQDLDQTTARRRVEQLVERRSTATNRGETDVVDLLTFELYKTYGVGIDDRSCTWSFGAKFNGNTSWQPPELPEKVTTLQRKKLFPPKLFEDEQIKYASPGYRRSKHSRHVPNDLILLRIDDLMQERVHLREEQKFIEADAIRKELWDTYYVGVNDRLKQWSVAGVLQEGDEEDEIRLRYVQTSESAEYLPMTKIGEIESLLAYLENTRLNGNDSAAECIIQRLRDVYQVVVDEDRMEWSFQGHGASSHQKDLVYTPKGSLRGIPSKQQSVIQALVDRRYKEQKSGNQQIADTISEALWRKHQIAIDDGERTWQVR